MLRADPARVTAVPRHLRPPRSRRAPALLTATAVGCAAVLVTGVGLASPAAAAGFDDAQWYYTDFNLAADHAKANGTGVKVAVVDGTIDTSVPELAGANIVTQPTSRCFGPDGAALPSIGTGVGADHATEIAVMLVGNGTGTVVGRGGSGVAPGITLLHYLGGVDAGDPANPTEVQCNSAAGASINDEATALAIDDAVAAGARVVSLSFTSQFSMASTASSIGRAERAGVVVVAGTNDHPDVSGDRVEHPASYNGVVAVNGIKVDSTLADNSAVSDLVAVAAPGADLGLGGHNPATGTWDSSGAVDGSSFATPFTAGVIADAMSAYPQATGNQILQLLLRTTGGTLHDLQRSADGLGFGVPSLTTMLENDPAQFPDENPLLRDGADPPTSDILGTGSGSTPTTSASPSPATTDGATAASTPARAAEPDSGSSAPWLLIGIVVVVVVIAAVVVIAVVARRRNRTGPPAAPPPYVHS